MKRYILSPRHSLLGSALSMDGRRMTPASRKKQIAEVRSARQQDPVEKEVVRWLREGDPTRIKPLSSVTNAQLIGARIVDMIGEEAERLRREIGDVSVIEDCELDLIQPDTETAGFKDSLQSSDLWHLNDIGLTVLRNNGFGGTGKGIGIAVLDTGIDSSHPDLRGRVVAHFAAAEDGPFERQPNGVDDHGHGTHVAGLICGKVTGVAPSASVIDCAMIPGGRGRLSDFTKALEWSARQPQIEILNMSAGLPGYREGLETQVTDLLATGVLPVVAVGNEGRNRTRSPGDYVQVFSVGASNDKRQVSSFSSSGQIVIDHRVYHVPNVVAPGENIYSCVKDGGYENWNGTSMATPIVSGIAALILEEYPELTVSDLGERLLETCLPLGDRQERYGDGLIQAVI